IDRAGVIVLEEDLLPGRAAVRGAKDAALRVRTVYVAQRRDEDDIRVARINDQGADLPRVFQPDVLPSPPPIRRFVNTVAGSEVAANAPFPRPDINHVRVRFRDSNRPYRRRP